MGCLSSDEDVSISEEGLKGRETYCVQTPSIEPNVQFMTAIWTKQAQIEATIWHEKTVLGGIFM
jgi:hypothetical protein